MIFDGRHHTLQFLGMVTGEERTTAAGRPISFARVSTKPPTSADGWIPAKLWTCSICEAHSPCGRLMCLGCQSTCLLELMMDAEDTFTPIGMGSD